MLKKKIVTVLGARPQFVKAAVLSRVIKAHDQIEEVIVHTGQHYDTNMSKVFFEEMQIPSPKYNLDINGMGHGAMTGQMMEKVEEVLLEEKPDAVVIYGDTNSTLAGALAARKLQIKVIHIEAGLRSFNMAMPEEVNRILTDRISDLLCCPTRTAIDNLKNEGFAGFDAVVDLSGDIMKDSVEFYIALSDEKSTIVSDFGLKTDEFVLATIHRQENTDDLDRLIGIFKGLEEIHKVKEVVMPLHPRTKAILEKHNLEFNIGFIDPVGYFDMLQLLKHSHLIVTDSGGLQKEAFFSGKRCLIARDETEWTELVKYNFAEIVGADKDKLVRAFENNGTHNLDYTMPLFGDQVGENIHKKILEFI